MHQQIDPAILYLGTPVVLISTENSDKSFNLSPMSSAWWLGWSCMLGLDASSKTTENLLRTGQCVLNLPSASEVSHVDRLARLTGSNPLPRHKQLMGYQFNPNKFTAADVNSQPSVDVTPPRVLQCPVQLEALLVSSHPFGKDDQKMLIPMLAIEVKIVKVHASKAILSDSFENRIDPEKWNPLLMSFLQFYSRGENAHSSRLAKVPEELYGGRTPVAKNRS